MTRVLTLLALAAALVVPLRPAEARPARHTARVAAPAPVNPAVKARAAAMDRFANRMSRLDALMGTARSTRARSASAEH
ncbi:hypothetical protein Q8W71_19465 [Methylobacterium sp. NEAU 140]|uniref:hypothetical protein n=1 Tax=Methylobacterium sp. NEAU 140 TaxID=3064945 RepID=UPI002733E649|nr:hypothetical protein [Methylobacterium sp. NEAU 140]MDP4024813.1 hypothetical protein [Methylobacterium sp. NEAU 140]